MTMPMMSATVAAVVALALLAVFGLIGFGWRTWLQHRRTGSTGFRGIGGKIGSAEWVAGLGLVIVLVVAVVGPVLQLCAVVVPVGVLHARWIQLAGIGLALLGIVLMVWAQIDMGDSWRIGVDESETTALVRTGVFGRVRNPIYTAMLTFAIGIALVAPNLVAMLGVALAVGTVELQVRRVEEPYLLGKHGDAYRGYTAGVGRFIPGVGLIR
jgi:protein-S-isoprenylcysteine O-methyltransferase Ste14